jgi:hypothetical protein
MSGVLIWLLSLSSAALGYLIFLAGKRHLDWSLRLCGFSAVTQGINPAAVLFLRYPGDEASLALIAFQAIQYLTNRLMETQMAVAKWLLSRSIVSRWRGLYFLFLLWLALLLGLALLYPVHRLVEGNAPFSGSTLDLVVSVGPVALILIAGLVTMLLGVAQGYLALALAPFEMLVAVAPFGWRLAAASLWIELTVESAPIGEWNVATLLPSMGSTTMRHGQGYEEPAALERIVKFVKDLAEPAQTSP